MSDLITIEPSSGWTQEYEGVGGAIRVRVQNVSKRIMFLFVNGAEIVLTPGETYRALPGAIIECVRFA